MTASTRRAARVLSPARVRERARLRADRAVRLVELRQTLAAERRGAEASEPVEAIRAAYREWRRFPLPHHGAVRAAALTYGVRASRVKEIVASARAEIDAAYRLKGTNDAQL